jgi:hypothetical protein
MGQRTCFVPEQTPHRKPQIQQHEHHKKPGVNSRDLYQNKHHTENHRSSNTNTIKNRGSTHVLCTRTNTTQKTTDPATRTPLKTGGQLTCFVPEQTPHRKLQIQQHEHHKKPGINSRALYQNKHHTENYRSSNTNTTKNRGSTHVLCTRTNITQKTTDPATRTPLKTGGQLTC